MKNRRVKIRPVKFRFGSKSIFVLVAVCGVAFAMFSRARTNAQKQLFASKELASIGCKVLHAEEYFGMRTLSMSVNGFEKTQRSPLIRKVNRVALWYETMLGEELFQRYGTVVLPNSPSFKLDEIEKQLKALQGLQSIVIYKDDFPDAEIDDFCDRNPNLKIEFQDRKLSFAVYDVDGVR